MLEHRKLGRPSERKELRVVQYWHSVYDVLMECIFTNNHLGQPAAKRFISADSGFTISHDYFYRNKVIGFHIKLACYRW